jgi:hypothetical protein
MFGDPHPNDAGLMLATGALLLLLDLLIKIVIRPLLETQRSIRLSSVIPAVDDDDDEWTKPRNNAIGGKHGPTSKSVTLSPQATGVPPLELRRTPFQEMTMNVGKIQRRSHKTSWLLCRLGKESSLALVLVAFGACPFHPKFGTALPHASSARIAVCVCNK